MEDFAAENRRELANLKLLQEWRKKPPAKPKDLDLAEERRIISQERLGYWSRKKDNAWSETEE